jgi:hypothetical protein
VKQNERDDVCYRQPRTLGERVAIANDFVKRFDYRIPLVVDPIENPANDAYSAVPERLYVIDENGRVAYKGRPGPFGFEPDELNSWLASRFPSGITSGGS